MYTASKGVAIACYLILCTTVTRCSEKIACTWAILFRLTCKIARDWYIKVVIVGYRRCDSFDPIHVRRWAGSSRLLGVRTICGLIA